MEIKWYLPLLSGKAVVMPLVNYRFYILNRDDRITSVQVVACEAPEVVERTAREVLDRELAAAAVEVWDRDRCICRVGRVKAAS